MALVNLVRTIRIQINRNSDITIVYISSSQQKAKYTFHRKPQIHNFFFHFSNFIQIKCFKICKNSKQDYDSKTEKKNSIVRKFSKIIAQFKIFIVPYLLQRPHLHILMIVGDLAHTGRVLDFSGEISDICS